MRALSRWTVAGVLVLASAAMAQTTYYVEPATAVNVGADGTTTMNTLVDITVATPSVPGTWLAMTNTTAPTGTTRYRISQGAATTATDVEFFRAYTPAYAAATQIAAGATAYADFYQSTAGGTSMTARAWLYEYSDATGLVGAAKGVASFTGSTSVTTRQTMNNVSFANPAFTVAAGNRLVVFYGFTTNNTRPRFLWGQSASGTPSGYQAFTVTESTTVNSTTPGAPAIAAASAPNACTGFSIAVPYTGDSDNNNSATLSTSSNGGTSWVAAANPTKAGSTFSGSATGLVFGTSYLVKVVITDTTGVSASAGWTIAGNTATYTSTAQVSGANCLGVGTATAPQTTGATPSLAISAPFTNDANANATVGVQSKTPTGGGAYGASTALTRGAGVFTGTLASLTCGASYDLLVTYSDGDGIGSGTAAQTISIAAMNTCAIGGTTTATPNTCTQVTVSAPFTQNVDGDGSTSFARGTAPGGPFTALPTCSAVTGASPRTCVDSTVTTGTYYYQTTLTDPDGVTTGVSTTGAIVVPSCSVPAVTPGAASVVINSCTQATVTAPFTGDSNANSTTTVTYSTTGAAPWTAITGCTAMTGASPRTCVASGLTQATAYYFKVDFADADGVTTLATQTIGPSTTLTCRTTTGAVSMVANTCTQVSANATFSGDANANGTTAFARGTSATGPWTSVAGCGTVSGVSPRSCVDIGAAATTAYYYQATFTDADTVTGTNPVVSATSVTTPACSATLNLAVTAQPAAGNVTAGSINNLVGKATVSASAGTITLTAIAVTNSGSALPNADVQDLLLYEDTNGDGLLTAADTLLGVSAWEASTSRYVFGSLAWTVTNPTARTLLFALNAAPGATATRTLKLGLAQANVTVASPNTVAATNFPLAGNTFTFIAGTWAEGDPTANSTKPVVVIVNPSKGATVSCDGPAGTVGFRVQADVTSGTAITAVTLSTDTGTTFGTTMTQNANYGALTTAGIWEATMKLAPGAYVLVVRATNASGFVDSGRVQIVVNPKGVGDGNLLVRDNSSQLCVDCHAIKTHSSANTSSKYGSWAVACRDCHTPHGTPNIFLVRSQITPPAVNGVQASRAVEFSAVTGATASTLITAKSFANEATNNGPCQVCHTRTQSTGAVARWRNTGNADTHYTSAAGTQSCVGCHPHSGGFAAGESKGTLTCANCHASIWNGMNGTTARTSKHTLGAVLGTNDSPNDTAQTWSGVGTLTSVLPANRSCVNMCHQDHIHNGTDGGVLHDANVHADATTSTTRAVTRDVSNQVIAGGATPQKTDFVAGTGGLCVSCHNQPVQTGHLTVTAAGYGAAAHNYTSNAQGTWTYTLHDNSTFARNCTKCHAERSATGAPSLTSSPFDAVHSSANASLLAGVKTPATTNVATFVCYNCHGTGAANQGYNLSGKNIYAQTTKTSGHPVNADTVHNSDTESISGAYGNTLGVTGRHVSCMDCHEPHQAKAGTHGVGTNLAGPPLQGAWGAKLSTNPAFWTATATTNFTKTTITAGTDLEATLCFKCHTSFYGTLPTSPSGAFTETDVAKEFNPANAGNWYTTGTTTTWSSGETAGGFHPVLASAGNNLGAAKLAGLVTTTIAWSKTVRNLMTCSDCHESETATDVNGPHGSTAKFILRGPNTTWSATVTNGATWPAGTFCLNCHAQPASTTSRFPQHTRSDHFIPCVNCHAIIPHGGPRMGMLNNGAATASAVGGNIAGWDRTAPYWGNGAGKQLYIASYPSTATTDWAQGNCGCDGTSH